MGTDDRAMAGVASSAQAMKKAASSFDGMRMTPGKRER
jgi:hypothetical protein